ncbi:MAG: PQQ-dependent sugar dehydrogenase, partial [Gemmatimonadota bacterium]|nr:PQQ-dependent sugar dehydrogenase [Gemmatimonadota bacterium]
THPFLPSMTGSTGTVSIPSFGHLETDIFYRIYARAEDSRGLVDTAFVDVTPRLVTMAFASVPAGLEITADGQPRTTPVDIPSVVGMEWSLDAPSPQSIGGTTYEFESWSQGGDATQTYVAPATDVALTATFVETGVANVPPSVSITSPASGATVTAGTLVTITADATDPDGTVTGVQFFEGAGSLGTDDTTPYSIEWTPTGTGPRELTARATDDEAAITVSALVNVTVQASGPGDVTAPVTTLTSPAHGTLDLSGSVSLTADATDDVGVTLVEFSVDGETIATDGTAPYEATLAATADYTTGAHTVRARARDLAGNWSPWSSAAVTFGGNVDLPAGFTRTTYASGIGIFPNAITTAAFTPDGRLLVLELNGMIRVVSNGAVLPTPFLDLDVVVGGELGLTGIALDPDFATNGYVYVHYTTDEGGAAHTRVSRFTANGDVAPLGSEVVLVELDDLTGATFHVGGALAFGPDGKLYVAVGDNTVTQNAQSLTSRFGKILRYNPDGTIPTDNPLVGSTTGVYQAIWALGLRNPYTIAFHPGDGRMHINDVGQDTWEEVNLGRPGANYGWPATEGPTTNPAYDPPLLAYRHSNSPTLFEGASVVGAAFYDPPSNLFGDSYVGDYFFADYVAGWVYRMDGDEPGTAYAFARLQSDPSQGITNLLVGDDGALYVLIGSRVDRIGR